MKLIFSSKMSGCSRTTTCDNLGNNAFH
jgi:hypothetical protein